MISYRQGDVLLIEYDSIPKDRKELLEYDQNQKQDSDNGRCILAYGEVTGHAHAIDSKIATMYSAEQVGNGGVLVVNSDGMLTHEEHGPIPVKKGKGRYRVIRQREYKRGEIVNVAD